MSVREHPSKTKKEPGKWWLISIGRDKKRVETVFNGSRSAAEACELQLKSGASTVPKKGEDRNIPPELPISNYDGPLVYFIQQGKFGPIKIGRTDKPIHHRIRSLQTSNPDRLRLVGFIIGGTDKDEYDLHDRFRSINIHGEWFYPASELLEYVGTVSHSFRAQTIINSITTIRELLVGVSPEKSSAIMDCIVSGEIDAIESLLR